MEVTGSWPEVIIYTTSYCPYCTGAKALLRSKKIKFEEIDVTRDPKRREEMEQIVPATHRAANFHRRQADRWL